MSTTIDLPHTLKTIRVSSIWIMKLIRYNQRTWMAGDAEKKIFSSKTQRAPKKYIFSTCPIGVISLNYKDGRFLRKVAVSGVITAGFELKPPPYPLDALEPDMSRETLDYHWGKHHKTYVENLNNQIVGTDLDGLSLEELVLLSYNKGNMLPAFNNAAQAWNHEFFWESIKPGGGGKPVGELLRLIERDFESFEEFLERFKSAAASQFGSGWTWLAYKANRLGVANAVNPLPKEEDKKLVIVKTPNAVNPLLWDYSPLLTIDTWEHAYYLDFENRRAEYINTYMDKLVSWETVSTRLESAMATAAQREKEGTETENEENPDDEEPEVYLDSEIDVSGVE